MTAAWPWLALVGLGAFHGINPGMGWLFAVALGLQGGGRAAVLRALGPIAAGHAAAVALAVIVLSFLSHALDLAPLRIVAAVSLIGFGIYRLMRGYGHRFRVGMRASAGDLMLWSFLMATAHGAGLMLAPVLLDLPMAAAPHHHGMTDPGAPFAVGFMAVLVHTAAMLAVMGLVALLVYEWVGLAVLRRGWVNLDLLWSGALILVGAAFLAAAAA